MATENFKCKLTDILSADVKGYNRLMGEDEEATVRATPVKIWFFIFLATLLAGFLPTNRPEAAQDITARLVNERQVGKPGPVETMVSQVELTWPSGEKRLLPYWTFLDPLVVSNRVFLFAAQDHELSRIVIFQADTRKLEEHPLPWDLDPYFGSPTFSPDGAKIAYYDLEGQRVLVRAWPSLKLLKASPAYPLRPTDMPPGPPVWRSSSRVDFDEKFFDAPLPHPVTLTLVPRSGHAPQEKGKSLKKH